MHRKAVRLALAAAYALAWAGPSSANPQFTGTEAGDVRIEENGSVYTITSSDGSIGTFSRFGNEAGETIRSVQAAADHTVVFKVTGTEPSVFYGALDANSRVFLVNPNGIVFGPGSRVNAPGLVAAAMDLKSADFISRRFRFEAPARGGTVLNEGELRAAPGGTVALVGSAVENRGTIDAPGGSAVLAAGGAATIGLDADGGISVVLTAPVSSPVYDLAGGRIVDGILNSGRVSAEGGRVVLSAQAMDEIFDQAINHRGVIEAQSVEDRNGVIVLSGGPRGIVAVDGIVDASGSSGQTGGDVTVTGENVALLAGTRIDASGGAGGGRVLVGGGVEGSDSAVPNASQTVVAPGARLSADALESGNGGTVVVWSEDRTLFAGALSARGAGAGLGGFAEISGSELVRLGTVDVSSGTGLGGTILYDPLNIQITGGTLDGSDNTDTQTLQLINNAGSNSLGSIFSFDEGASLPNPFLVYESEIENTAADIILEARRSVTISGTFTGGLVLQPNRTLVIRTLNGTADPGVINLSGLPVQTSGTGSITIYGGLNGQAVSSVTLGPLQSGTGDITVFNDTGSILADTILTGGGDVDLDGAGVLKLTGGIISSGGDIFLQSSGGNTELLTSLTLNSSSAIAGGWVYIGGPLLPSTANVDFTIDSRGLSVAAGGDIDLHAVVPNGLNGSMINDLTLNASGPGGGGWITFNANVDVGPGSDAPSITATGGDIYMFTATLRIPDAAGITLTSDADVFLGFLNADSNNDATFGNVSVSAAGQIFDDNGNLPNVKAGALTFSAGSDVGASYDPLEVEYLSLSTTGVAGSVYLAPFSTTTAAGSTAGVTIQDNRITGGENFLQFTSDVSTATDPDTQESTTEDKKEEEGDSPILISPLQALPPPPPVDSPAAFPQEKPVQSSTFSPCANA